MNQPFCSPVQALRSVLDAAALLPSPSPETIPLEAACGRIAAGDLCAKMDQPPFDRSPLDGYALHSADTAGASRENPVTLPVVMKLYAGDAPAAALPAGCAARIMTGAPLPEDADCVLMQELTDSGEETVQLYAAVKPLQNVVFRGEDVAAGAVIAPAGTVLTPAHLGVLAGQGYAEVTVCRPLTVGILSTGSELLAPGAPWAPGKIYDANGIQNAARLRQLGFADVVEVAIGADLCTVDEAHDFLEEVPEKLDFMATSCCPAWSMMAKTAFPGLAKNISMTMTPMVFTARMMKQKDPTARMCFIGPCAAKKLEASRRTVRSDVDFVLTFEELAGIIEGKDLDIDLLEVDENEAALCSASAAGRGFAQSGGVANAVANKIKEWHPDMEVKIASAQGLADCKKLLMLAKAGKYNGYLLEGMGCPGGCIGGAGTIADPARTAIQLNKYMKEAPFTDPEQSPYMSEIHVLKDDPNFEL